MRPILRSSNPAPLQLFVVLLTVAIAASARAQQPSQEELSNKINGLQSQIDELKEQLKQAQAERAAEVAATTQAVMRDAESRSHPLSLDGVTATYTDGKFTLRTADGNFVLRPWLQFQLRNTTTYRQDVKQGGTGDDVQNGFEIRRLKLGLEGNVFSPDLSYNFIWAANRKDGVPELEAAYAKYHFAQTPYSIRLGQFKDPLDHEQLGSTKYTTAVDRTLTDDFFAKGEGYVQGASVIFDSTKDVRAEVALTDGLGSVNENFQDFPTTSADWGTAGRVEYKLFGKWNDYEHLTMYGLKQNLLVFGAGADYTEQGSTSFFTHVVDAQFGNAQGIGFYGAYLGRYGKDVATGAATSDTYDWTLRAQVSYSIDRRWQPFLQYEYIHFDAVSLAAGAENEVHVIRVGTSYFIYGESARFQFDLSYLPNGSPVNDDGAGILQDNGNNELVFRAQFQLLL